MQAWQIDWPVCTSKGRIFEANDSEKEVVAFRYSGTEERYNRLVNKDRRWEISRHLHLRQNLNWWCENLTVHQPRSPCHCEDYQCQKSISRNNVIWNGCGLLTWMGGWQKIDLDPRTLVKRIGYYFWLSSLRSCKRVRLRVSDAEVHTYLASEIWSKLQGDRSAYNKCSSEWLVYIG